MKRYLKKHFLPPIFLCIILLLFPLLFYALLSLDSPDIPTDVLQTKQYDVSYRLQEDGSCYIEEKMTIKAHCQQILKQIGYSVNRDNPIADYDTYPQNPQFDGESFRYSLKSIDGETIFDLDGKQNYGNIYHGDLFSFSWNQGETHEWYDEPSYVLNHYTYAQAYFYLENKLDGDYILTYSYRIEGMAMTYADISELNWIFASSNDMKMKNVTVTIDLPEIAGAQKEEVYVYGHGAKGTIEMSTPSHIVLHANELKGDEKLEARIMFPRTWLNQEIIAEEKPLYFHQSSKEHLQNALDFEKKEQNIDRLYMTGNILAIAGDIFLILLIILFTYFTYKKYDKEYKASFEGPYYRELPNDYEPALLGYLYYFKQTGKDDVTATLLDLIRRKYISIDTNGSTLTEKKPNYMMTLNREKYESEKDQLKSFETVLIEWFFTLVSADKTHLSLNELDTFNQKESNALAYQRYNNQFTQEIAKNATTYSFFEDGKKAAKFGRKFIFPFVATFVIGLVLSMSSYMLSFFYMIALSLVGIVWVSAYSTKVIRRTKEANEDYVKWKAFRKFLTDFSSMKDYPMPSVTIWEHYLVYATTLGVANLVEKQLRMRFKESGREIELESSSLFYYPHFGTYYCARVTASAAIGQQTIAKARAERASRSSGGGRGGFGGGSSFGGGGGHMSAR